MAKLKKSRAVAADASDSKKSSIPTAVIEGDLVSSFNDAIRRKKEAEDDANECREEVLKAGVPLLIAHNTDHADHPVASIVITDAEESSLRLTFMNKYQALTPDAAEELCKTLADGDEVPDVNQYFQEVVKPVLDVGIFYVSGKFDDGVFNAYQAAITRVTSELIARGKLMPGTPSPLLGKRVVEPKPDFHQRRWVDFNSDAQQKTIYKHVPNTVTLTPVAD